MKKQVGQGHPARSGKRWLAFFMSLCLTVTMLPAMSGGAVLVQAATTPSVTAFATPSDLMDDTFKPDGNGQSTTIGKLVFGKNSNGDAQEWYILGKDDGVTGDNTIIFAANPIIPKWTQVFYSSSSPQYKAYDASRNCTYPSETTISQVRVNHYGTSDLRAVMNVMVADDNIQYFTKSEKDLMNDTEVETNDEQNGVNYTTTDKLYALAADRGSISFIKAGSRNDTIILSAYSYWMDADRFWLRSPYPSFSTQALMAKVNERTGGLSVDNSEPAVRPASNLDLSNVIFASGAQVASDAVVSGKMEKDDNGNSTRAMTLRLNGSSKAIGTVIYNETNGKIAACKDDGATGIVSLVIQGNDGTDDWYYSAPVGGATVVTKDQIMSACGISTVSFANCKIWLETTIDNVTYAKMAEANNFTQVTVYSVAVTGMDAPEAGLAFDTSAACNTTGITTNTPAITYTTAGDNGDVQATGNADWNKVYKASVTLATGSVNNNTFYVFDNSVSATIDGVELSNSIAPNADGTLTLTKEFDRTAKRKITGVTTAPEVPTTFTTYYNHEGYSEILTNGGNVELGTQAEVTLEGKGNVPSTIEAMDVTWTIEAAAYDNTPGATNTFRWTIPATELADYNATDCQGYDNTTGTIKGTVSIANKAATPVTITGTDSSIEYTGEVIDVSQYFSIDTNAGTATYTNITSVGDGMGIGTLNGSLLTVTQTGVFQIKVNTAANGIYAAGESTITLTVDNGNIQYTMSDYSGNYDGQPHSITLAGLVPDDAIVTYSADGITFDAANPSFTNVGTYTVYYSISKDNYNTSNGSKTVTINKKPLTIKADEQNIIWGNSIDQSRYTTDGLATGDSIADVTLSPSTSALTDNGTISVSDVKIVNAAGEDVTGNYDITMANGTLKITHDTTLPLDRIEAVKTKTSYTAGDTLNVDDITVTAYYTDGYSMAVTGFTTNADAISMSVSGDKTLTVSYTEKGITKTDDIAITVKKAVIYQIIDGANSSYIAGNGNDLTIRGDGDFFKFVGVKVDGNLVDPNYYTAKEGSTIITLKSSYMNTLSAGTHTIVILWTDGSASTTFTINANANDSSNQNNNAGMNQNNNSLNKKDAVPKTGDTTPIAGLFVLAMLSGVGLLLTKKKGRKNLR